MNNIEFTVFTPTYNRSYTLDKLYNSLKNQTFRDFEWLIVDDGSTDNTEAKIRGFIAEEVFPIKYIKKKNEGKHVGINVGAKEARGEWFFIVDSDDWIVRNALEVINDYCFQIDKNEEFAGVVGLRGNSTGKVWNTSDITKEGEISNFNCRECIDASTVEYRYKFKIEGDRAEVIRTSLLRKYPFPSFSNEKFMPERYLWFKLSEDGYKFRWFNEVIYITEYLEDGLTQNGKELAKKNCKSRSACDNYCSIVHGIPFKEKMKFSINYFRYGKYAGENYAQLFNDAQQKYLRWVAAPIAMICPIK